MNRQSNIHPIPSNSLDEFFLIFKDYIVFTDTPITSTTINLLDSSDLLTSGKFTMLDKELSGKKTLIPYNIIIPNPVPSDPPTLQDIIVKVFTELGWIAFDDLVDITYLSILAELNSKDPVPARKDTVFEIYRTIGKGFIYCTTISSLLSPDTELKFVKLSSEGHLQAHEIEGPPMFQ